MPARIQISGKNLGELNHAGYCRRCIWIKLRLHNRLPYQVFPGIFSSIDAYTKEVVRHFLDKGGPPAWLGELGDIVDYRPAPSYQKFYVDDPETGVRLTGAADALFVRSDGSYLIADYKTARYTPGQDALWPTYEAQLNAYAWIAERTAWSPVSKLALVYMEPRTGARDAADEANHRDYGFAMGFTPYVEFIEIRPELIPRLLRQAREIFDEATAPQARRACKDCEKVDRLTGLLGK